MSVSSIGIATLGTPRIGPRRELKAALESYWSGKSDEPALLEAAFGLRVANWARQRGLGITVIPSNDFSLYDHVLDTSTMVGAVPEIYEWKNGPVPVATYFAMARGARAVAQQASSAHGHRGTRALEMTKWFDTNYHYMVPEFTKGQRFELSSFKPLDEYREAKALGYQTRPVLLGPVTYLKLSAEWPRALSWRDRRTQCLARRSTIYRAEVRTYRGEARHRSRPDRTILFAPARSDRSRP